MLLVFSTAEHFPDLPYNAFVSAKGKNKQIQCLKTGRAGEKTFVHLENQEPLV